MSDCSHKCSTCAEKCNKRTSSKIKKEETNELSKVKKIIAVVSGKGGVGKTLSTSLLASEMSKKGYKTAILDTDITGPSIPKTFGIDKNVTTNDIGIIPTETKSGIKIMSENLVLKNNTDPVMWRGPIITKRIIQFFKDTCWGDVDYMFIDMPPGTGDVPITIYQSIPLDGVIIVTTPQQLVKMIVEKGVNMAKRMNIPILGIVENMSYFVCPHCNEKHYIFGDSKVEEIASKYDIKNVARIPIDSDITKSADEGKVEEIDAVWLRSILDNI